MSGKVAYTSTVRYRVACLLSQQAQRLGDGAHQEARFRKRRWTMQPLKGKVAVVAGATRGAGRGIACMLGEAGATVYCTGRSVRGKPSTKGRPETIEETAKMVTARGGAG